MNAEIQALLVPVSVELPEGVNREYETDYEVIRQARESDPDDLPQDEWSVERRVADWPLVVKRSKAFLQTQSKDFTIAMWLTEGWLQLKHLNGLQGGLQLLTGMVEQYWESGWPALCEDGMLYRTGKFSWLDKKLCEYLLTLPLLGDEQSSLAFWHQVLRYEHSQKMSGADTSEEDDFSMASYQRWASGLPVQKIHDVESQLESCSQYIDTLNAHGQQKGIEDVLLGATKALLEDISHFMVRLRGMAATDAQALMAVNVLAMDTELSHSPATEAQPRPQALSRDVGISQMLTLAHFFRQTEPSSPVPFLLERAARWANMSLTEWLEEMLNDSGSLNDINAVLKGQIKE